MALEVAPIRNPGAAPVVAQAVVPTREAVQAVVLEATQALDLEAVPVVDRVVALDPARMRR